VRQHTKEHSHQQPACGGRCRQAGRQYASAESQTLQTQEECKHGASGAPAAYASAAGQQNRNHRSKQPETRRTGGQEDKSW
jgi:hypothetical protein